MARMVHVCVCFGVQIWLWLKVDDGTSGSHGAKKASFEQIKTGAAIHLALHQFQFGVLPFGLAVRPWLGEGRHHRVLILDDPRGK